MGKDAKGKGKGKTRAKKVKGGKCAAEKQDVKESTDILLLLKWVPLGRFHFLHHFRQIPTKNLARSLHWRWLWFLSYLFQGYLNAADLQQMLRLSKAFGQTKSLCRFRQGFFFFPRQYGAFSFFFGPFFFLFSLPKDFFSAFDFSIEVSVKRFHVGSFVKCVM